MRRALSIASSPHEVIEASLRRLAELRRQRGPLGSA